MVMVKRYIIMGLIIKDFFKSQDFLEKEKWFEMMVENIMATEN